MSNTTTHIYLITGGNRGLGKCLGFVEDIATRDFDSFIYAGARDPSTATALKDLADKFPGRVEVVKCVSGDEEGNKSLAEKIREKHGRVDTAIANAGIANYVGNVHETPRSQFSDHFEVNTMGPIVLFQAIYSLLKASPSPTFVPISSIGGSAKLNPPLPIGLGCYGASKSALNWLSRKIHFENEWLICFPLHPGGVMTDMATYSIEWDKSGTLAEIFAKDSFTPLEAAKVLMEIINGATREKEGGEFVNFDGTRLAW